MNKDFEPVFNRLKEILRRQTGTFTVREAPGRYALQGGIGPAAVKAWGGKMKRTVLPVAWVETGKAYVSYHLMGIYGNAALLDGMSKELKARMQGKTCFNFKSEDDALFGELEQLTARSIGAFRDAEFIVEQQSAARAPRRLRTANK
jgi:hypothetical protein